VSRHQRLVRFTIAAGAAVVTSVGIRRWQTRWGATQDEITRRLPGDDVVVAPQYWATNAVTVDAAPRAVWPWLVQMGAYGRAGWYAIEREELPVPQAGRVRG